MDLADLLQIPPVHAAEQLRKGLWDGRAVHAELPHEFFLCAIHLLQGVGVDDGVHVTLEDRAIFCRRLWGAVVGGGHVTVTCVSHET